MSAIELTPAERKALKADAHDLSPVAAIGKAGITPSLLKEIDLCLRSHALIKVRAGSDERDDPIDPATSTVPDNLRQSFACVTLSPVLATQGVAHLDLGEVAHGLQEDVADNCVVLGPTDGPSAHSGVQPHFSMALQVVGDGRWTHRSLSNGPHNFSIAQDRRQPVSVAGRIMRRQAKPSGAENEH